MYIDEVVLSGIVIVVLTCVFFGFVGRFAYRHFKMDEDSAKLHGKTSGSR